jgi:protein-disulfide isomerase-like protein with CxxC motif
MRGPHRSCQYGAVRPTAQHTTSSMRCDITGRGGRGALGRPEEHLHDGLVLPGPGMVDASTLLVYIMDVYDPWSYAYLPSVSAVLSAACSLVDVEIVQSGHDTTGRSGSFAADVDAVRGATDACFGPEFLAAVRSGSLVVDAEAAAAGVIALLATEQMPVSTVIGAVQHEFFVCGQPLEAPGVLGRVATNLGLDAQAIELFATSARAHELAVEDFAVARDLNVGGRPLLLASRGDRLFEFDGLGASSQRLVDQFRTVLTRP